MLAYIVGLNQLELFDQTDYLSQDQEAEKQQLGKGHRHWRHLIRTYFEEHYYLDYYYLMGFSYLSQTQEPSCHQHHTQIDLIQG